MDENQKKDTQIVKPSPILFLGYIVIAGLVFFLIWQQVSDKLWGTPEKYLMLAVIGIPLTLFLGWIWKRVFQKL
ncbi:MAG: hypothetical protein WAT71_17975 [Ignavibacteria bacterium]